MRAEQLTKCCELLQNMRVRLIDLTHHPQQFIIYIVALPNIQWCQLCHISCDFCVFVYFCIVFYLFCLFTYFHFFPVFTCKYILTLKKAKAESALSLIYSCTVNGLIPLYTYFNHFRILS